MRTIERSTAFKKDYKRESKGRHKRTLDESLVPVLNALVEDVPLDARLSDHELSGSWSKHRDCHIKPDLVLIYQKVGSGLLRLVRLGSHSELFG